MCTYSLCRKVNLSPHTIDHIYIQCIVWKLRLKDIFSKRLKGKSIWFLFYREFSTALKVLFIQYVCILWIFQSILSIETPNSIYIMYHIFIVKYLTTYQIKYKKKTFLTCCICWTQYLVGFIPVCRIFIFL